MATEQYPTPKASKINLKNQDQITDFRMSLSAR